MTSNTRLWKVMTLDDCLESLLRGMAPKYVQASPIAALNQKALRWGHINEQALKYHDPNKKIKEEAFIRKGDIALNSTGDITIGRAFFFKRAWPNLFADSHVAILRLKTDVLLPDFLIYLLPTEEYQRKIYNLVTGATGQLELNRTRLRQLEVVVPPIRIQQKIASILSAYDDLIENNTRRIAILEEMAQAIYREWFVNFRFPGHENVKLVQSTLGMIPEGWKWSKLKDVCDSVNYGYTASANKEVEVGPRFLRITDIVPSTIDWENVPYCELVDDDAEKYALHEGNIVIARTGATTGYAKRLHKRHPKSVFASYLVRIIPNASMGKHYIGLIVESTDYKAFIKRNLGGAAQPQANAQVLTSLDVLVPSLEVIQAFDGQVEPIADQKEILQIKNRNLRKTRDLLLPKLISGQLDVEDIDIDLGLTAEEISEATVRVTAEVDNASTASTTSVPEAIPVDELDVDQVMAEFRQQARRLGTTTRGELLKAVSQELGYKRLGHNIEEVLKGHLRAAIRRKIIAADGELVCLHTPSMETYERDELIEAFHSVMRKNTSYVRKDVIRALANHLGFRRISDTVREPIKSAINGAIRRGVLGYQGELIWREG